MLLFKCEIPGRVPVKKNTAKVYRYGAVYSKAYRNWEILACGVIRKLNTKVLKNCPVREYFEARFKFFLKNHQWEPDVSNVCEGPQDVLQTCGVIDDDKLIKRVIAEKFFDDPNPRLEIELHSLKI